MVLAVCTPKSTSTFEISVSEVQTFKTAVVLGSLESLGVHHAFEAGESHYEGCEYSDLCQADVLNIPCRADEWPVFQTPRPLRNESVRCTHARRNALDPSFKGLFTDRTCLSRFVMAGGLFRSLPAERLPLFLTNESAKASGRTTNHCPGLQCLNAKNPQLRYFRSEICRLSLMPSHIRVLHRQPAWVYAHSMVSMIAAVVSAEHGKESLPGVDLEKLSPQPIDSFLTLVARFQEYSTSMSCLDVSGGVRGNFRSCDM